jgi:FkbM family methyltransferase
VGRLGRLLTRSAPPKDERLRLLHERRIDAVLDVGANEGLYAARLRAGGYRGRIVSFEPLSAAFAKLERASADDPDWQCIQTAVGARRGTAVLNVAGNWASSSLLPMDERLPQIEPRTAYVGTQECTVETLDDLGPRALRSADRAFLKLDVQGYELEALLGAEQTLRQVEAVEVELSLSRRAGSPGRGRHRRFATRGRTGCCRWTRSSHAAPNRGRGRRARARPGRSARARPASRRAGGP